MLYKISNGLIIDLSTVLLVADGSFLGPYKSVNILVIVFYLRSPNLNVYSHRYPYIKFCQWV